MTTTLTTATPADVDAEAAREEALALGHDHGTAAEWAAQARRLHQLGKCSTSEHGHRNHEQAAGCSGWRSIATAAVPVHQRPSSCHVCGAEASAATGRPTCSHDWTNAEALAQAREHDRRAVVTSSGAEAVYVDGTRGR